MMYQNINFGTSFLLYLENNKNYIALAHKEVRLIAEKKAWVLWLINLFLFGGFVWNISQQSVWIAKLDNQSSNFFNSLIEPSLTHFFIIIARLFTPLLVLIYTAAITEFLKNSFCVAIGSIY